LSQLFAFNKLKENLVKNRVSLLLLVLACLLALAPGASAQDTECLNLSADDCAIITTAQANSDNMKSALLTFAVDFTLGGLESFEPSAAGGVEFHVSGTGPFTFTGVPDPTTMMSGDIGAAVNAINLQMDLQIDITAPGEDPVSLPVSVVIADGNFYFQDPESGAWQGITGEDLAAQMGEMSGMMGAMGGVDPNAMSDPSAMAGMLPPELLTALSSVDLEALAATPGFLNNQRLPDEELFGQTVAPFQFTIDFGALFKSTEFQQMLSQLSTAAMTSTDTEVQQAAQILMVLPMFLQNTTATVDATQWVGATDQMIHKVALDIDADIDLSMLAGMSGDADAAAAAATMQPITIDFHFDAAFDQINGTFDIVAPEGATMMDANS
jgi:hypothetical protein